MPLELFAPAPQENIHDCFKVRHQAFCVEQCWESINSQGVEFETKDAFSLFVLIYEDGNPVATCRVTPLRSDPSVAEVSRVAIVKACIDRKAVRTMIVDGIIKISHEFNITRWLGFMEPRFIRLNRYYGLTWELVGPVFEHHGKRSFCFMKVPVQPKEKDNAPKS